MSVIFWTDEDHWKARLNQADGPVFAFSGGIGYGGNVGYLHEFQSILKGDSRAYPPSQKEETLFVAVFLSELFYLLLLSLNNLLNDVWYLLKLLFKVLNFYMRNLPHFLGKP